MPIFSPKKQAIYFLAFFAFFCKTLSNNIWTFSLQEKALGFHFKK